MSDEPITEAELENIERIGKSILERFPETDLPETSLTLRLVAEIRRLRAALQRIAADDTLLYGAESEEPTGHTTLRRIARHCLDPDVPLRFESE
jgi:hypothetical protein